MFSFELINNAAEALNAAAEALTVATDAHRRAVEAFNIATDEAITLEEVYISLHAKNIDTADVAAKKEEAKRRSRMAAIITEDAADTANAARKAFTYAKENWRLIAEAAMATLPLYTVVLKSSANTETETFFKEQKGKFFVSFENGRLTLIAPNGATYRSSKAKSYDKSKGVRRVKTANSEFYIFDSIVE